MSAAFTLSTVCVSFVLDAGWVADRQLAVALQQPRWHAPVMIDHRFFSNPI
jgi:hypothetical protein